MLTSVFRSLIKKFAVFGAAIYLTCDTKSAQGPFSLIHMSTKSPAQKGLVSETGLSLLISVSSSRFELDFSSQIHI